ncbi:polysaccharide biosynthesis/export family protein [Pannonibacter sp. Q-1]|uniref:Polysaccharide export protein Wza n=2 Tax=Pannonibacter TaxID=227873 RepID=A0A0L0J6P6_9HYPH|nr:MULTISPECIES: polysaccharide biosynthesis/export family protein [Pannonibacter]MBA4205764.1 sugar transporter [Polymorphum sp.]ALV29374.1 sugar transporter [Pannonibacter phragmitetus]KND21386.1 sugar transporter [Pannonibacter phragmitetus]CUB00383.1 Periplasmic protein involved in polysaccharide export, contains SLBB domain of the beta-grasp fold [Pannonibacter indicus]SUB00518.1 polysaccharide export protein Wza [Pannonibacter phragmitetus]
MYARLFAAFAIALTLAGCSGYKRPPSAFHEILTQPYRLDSSDRLRIIVFGQNDLSNTYVVDQAGYISMPLIGSVPARGKTQQELAKAIEASLRKGFLRDPNVSVEVDQYRPIFVMGEVQAAGQYAYVPGMTVQNAIATAGGFSARAEQASADLTRQINGEILNGRVPITDPVRPGDTIHVRERLF